MYFLNANPRFDDILEILNQDDAKLEDILEKDSVLAAIRSPNNSQIMDYLKQPEITDQLFSWCLSIDHVDDERFKKLSNSAMKIISESKPFQQFLLRDENRDSLIEKFQKYIDSNCNHPHVNGHFSRIFESYVRSTQGKILINLPNLSNFLIANITIIALRDLFINLCNDFQSTFLPSDRVTEIFTHLVESINEQNCYFVTSAISELVSNNTNLRDQCVNSEIILNKLFELSIEYSRTDPLLAIGLLKLLTNLQDLSNYPIVFEKYVQNIQYQNNCSLPFQISLYKKLLPSTFELFFHPDSCTMLNESIFQAFSQLKIDEQLTLINETEACQKIQDNIQCRSNPRIADLAVIIAKNCSNTVAKQFISFAETTAQNRINDRDKQYGGKICDSDDDDDDQFITPDFKGKEDDFRYQDSSSSEYEEEEEFQTDDEDEEYDTNDDIFNGHDDDERHEMDATIVSPHSDEEEIEEIPKTPYKGAQVEQEELAADLENMVPNDEQEEEENVVEQKENNENNQD